MDQYFDYQAPLYVPIRYVHDTANCSRGKDACLIVTRYPTHFKWFCHRCGKGGEHKIKNLAPGDMVKLWKANKIYKDRPRQQQKEVRLPEDFTNKIGVYTPVGECWLATYGITKEEVVKYNIGYSQHYRRLIFPVYQDNELVYWQGRTIDEITKDNPKWINIKKLGRKDIYFHAGHGSTVVLVEDIISAIKVGRVAKALGLLGSYIDPELALDLFDKRVLIWLDNDKRGQAIKYSNRMSALGVRCHIRVTSRDPKDYSEEDIRRKIK